jgi:hypothetical protein
LKKPEQGQTLRLKPNGGQVYKEKCGEEWEDMEAEIGLLFHNLMF